MKADATLADDLPAGLRFLAGGGAASRLILERDWSAHWLGPPATWPDALKVALGLVLNSPESMILAWGREQLSFFFNETYFPLLGPRLDWAMGAPFVQVWADGWEQARPIIDAAFAGRSRRFVDLPWVLDTDRGRRNTWWSFSYSRVLDADGAVAGLFIFTNETTDRVLADMAAREATARLRVETERQRLSLQQMPGFIAILSGPDHMFEYVNDAYVAIAGPRPLLGRTVREVFPEIAGQGYFEELDQVFATGKTFHARAMPLRLDDGSERYIDHTYHPIRDTSGAITGIFVGGYDVTQVKQAERTLKDYNEQLTARIAERTAELEQAHEQLRQSQKMEAVGQLTGGLAHDFNNMLTAVTGGLELLGRRLEAGRTDGLDRYIGIAQSGARRAAALTQRLLAFSRRQMLDPTPTDIDRLVAGMREIVGRALGPAIAVRVVATSGLWPVLVDAPQLENALLNLCLNARDAMPDGGRLTIETGNMALDRRAAAERDLPVGEYVALSVTDTGIGMTPEIQARAFDPFFTTKPIGEGTGLGLSMIYGFVRQSGGQVRIRSQPGQGTTMCLYLPRHRGEPVEAGPGAAAALAGAAEVAETVLVVEDEAAVRDLMREVLADAGYRVLEAADGPAGMRVLHSAQAVDLLITDVGLPGGLNGRQVADAGRVARPGLKVLFVTGYAAHAAVGAGQMDQGMSILTKPFDTLELERRVREMIAGTA